MHFSIPDIQEFNNHNDGSYYTGFNIHLNGSFHCCVRFKQLYSLNEQLKKSVDKLLLPPFPSRKLLPLTPNQVEDRRVQIERYIQLVGQDPILSKSEILRLFLINAQQESSFTERRIITLPIHLMNGFPIEVKCETTECSTIVLEKSCQNIGLSPEFTYYFALFLMRKEKNGNISLVRKLMDFESPFMSQRLLNDCTIVIRKNYWDPMYDSHLMQNNITLNLLYIQTISDIERDWVIQTNDVRDQLIKLKLNENRKEYLELAKRLPSYGCIKFSNAIVDYPTNETDERIQERSAFIIIGNKELCIRTSLFDKIQETKFKVTRMRCWRVITKYNTDEFKLSKTTSSNRDISGGSGSYQDQPTNYHMELSFEYLMSKNCLKWITIISEQAVLMSVCLQSMVDELIKQKGGNDLNNIQIRNTSSTNPSLFLYIPRDEHQRIISESSSTDTISSLMTDAESATNTTTVTMAPLSMKKKLRDKISTTVLFRTGRGSVHNEAFEGIGDDDL